jgi:RNA polymerase sigma-70 factor (ECF subfamily)
VRNNTISAMRRRRSETRGSGDSGLLRQLAAVPAAEAFDDEVRRAAFHQAADLVRAQVQPATWNAFWQTSVLGHAVEKAARELSLSVGSVYAARSRVLARLRHEIEIILGEEE